MKKTIVGLGELLWDVFPNKKVLGGAPANFAYHASQLGFDGYVVSAVGEDSEGQEILDILKQREVKNLIEKVNKPTGRVNVTLKNGDPSYEIINDVAWDNIPFTEKTEALARKADAACFGTLSQRSDISKNTIQKFIKAMPPQSLKVLDINLRQNFYNKELIEESLKLANVLKINEDEIITLFDLFNLKGENGEEACQKLKDIYNLEAVIFTCGINGSYIYTDKETSFQNTPDVRIADTVGAGDAFTAAFIASYLAGERIVDSHKMAKNIAAYVCMQNGAMPILPDAYRGMFA